MIRRIPATGLATLILALSPSVELVLARAPGAGELMLVQSSDAVQAPQRPEIPPESPRGRELFDADEAPYAAARTTMTR